MPPPELAPNKPLPRHPEFDQLATSRAFWRLSFRCGRDYVDGVDAKGGPVIYPHEREREGYERRKRSTKPRNHAGPIVRRYNDFVFRSEAVRPKEDTPPAYDLLLANCDGHGTPLARFMKSQTLVAQIERDAFILVDSTKRPDAGAMSLAQAKSSGVRPILKSIAPDAVVWWRDFEGVMVEALVLLEREDGTEFARWYGATQQFDVELKRRDASKTLMVESIGPVSSHGYAACPLIRQRPGFDGDSQIAPMAESQQGIANYQSLLNEELYNVTFSQLIATGVSADQVKDTVLGQTRLICLPNPGSSFTVIGADPAQAESIRKAIEDEERNLYRIAGVSCGDPLAGPSAPESGVAKAFAFNDLAANLAALAQSAQEAENTAVGVLMVAQGAEAPVAEYPLNFDLPDLAAELTDVIRVSTVAQIPPVIKRKVMERFAHRNFKFDDAEQAELETQLDALGQDMPSDPANPIPGRTAMGS